MSTATKESKFEDQDNADDNGKWNWKNAKSVALQFFTWLHDEHNNNNNKDDKNRTLKLASVDRDTVHELFEQFMMDTQEQKQDKADNGSSNKKKNHREQKRLEGIVMSALRRQKLLKTKRYSDGIVICSFCNRDQKTFPPLPERQTARDRIRQERAEMEANKGGLVIPYEPDFPASVITGPAAVLPINQTIHIEFPIEYTVLEGQTTQRIVLVRVRLSGSHSKNYKIESSLPQGIQPGQPDDNALQLSFCASAMGVYRVNILMYFKVRNDKTKDRDDGPSEQFSILRSVILKAGGDAAMYDALLPKSPYQKKKRTQEKLMKKENVMNPPKQQGGSFTYKNLAQFKIPVDVKEMIENREMDAALVPPELDMKPKDYKEAYTSFWQNLVWTSEAQAYEDIKLFDLENIPLQRSGRFFKLYVAGLAEGRPSVLRGDLVDCIWKGKKYRGRVFAIELLDVLLEFHSSFHKNFNVNLDRVESVRFTFTRTHFRTAHAGILRAPSSLGQRMLMPQPKHVEDMLKNHHQREPRVVPKALKWASTTLNEEQKSAVSKIVEGKLRPMPYVIFGPPGTGKTTTMVEAVYQLSRLHKSSNSSQSKLKILLVAPSNDATDILVEKLAPYFPPSEMLRFLAHTRSIDQVPAAVKPYVRDGIEPQKLISEIVSKHIQIVVSTVNLAARLWCMGEGVSSSCFDVLCVDEAGHATEPEVVGVLATTIKFSGKAPQQVILAGDPNQLGPIITSDLCKKFGMDISYMERLVKTCPAYAMDESSNYPPDLVTLLVRNYRSHPAILKLPNEMFYDNKLVPCGDHFTTHSMTRWEHLPKSSKGFPVLFHAIDGENLREGTSPSWFNPQEALQVVEYVKLLVKHSRPPISQDDIGIITPYARQVQKIKLTLKASDMGDIKCGSVETFQGQERRCIIISTVRSETTLVEHDLKFNLGFVANEKRFNVAVTRAKALLIVVGNPRVLETDRKNWMPFLKYCNSHGSWAGDEWEEGVNEDDVDKFVARAVGGLTMEDAVAASEDSGDEWQMVTDQEVQGFINREE